MNSTSKSSGAYSRSKGRRVEYLLRDHLRSMGYEAVRVPLSGASEGFKADIVATKDGCTLSFEMKARASAFKRIYALYDIAATQGRLLFCQEGISVAISTDFEKVKFLSGGLFLHAEQLTKQSATWGRTVGKIMNLAKLLGEADYLVIKDDRKPFLFIHYYG